MSQVELMLLREDWISALVIYINVVTEAAYMLRRGFETDATRLTKSRVNIVKYLSNCAFFNCQNIGNTFSIH